MAEIGHTITIELSTEEVTEEEFREILTEIDQVLENHDISTSAQEQTEE